MRTRISLLLLLTLTACGKEQEKITTRTYSDLATSLDDAQRESLRSLGRDGSRARASWDSVPGADAWSAAVLEEVALHRAVLEQSRDLGDFCPGYARAKPFEKGTCWLRLFSAMARFESHFKPAATFLESSGRTSVGLLMMNPAHCPGADTEEKLKDPVANIHCAATRLALLVRRDGYLSGPERTGGAAYWSTLRDPYTQGALLLGRKPHIQLFTRSYRGFRQNQ